MHNIHLAAVLIGGGSVLLTCSLTAFLRLIPRNIWIGFRFPKALQSDENWYKINKYWGGKTIFWSSLNIVVGIWILFIQQIPSQKSHLLLPILILLPVLWPAVRTVQYMKKLPDTNVVYIKSNDKDHN